MIWMKREKVLIFASGRMIPGRPGEEVVDVLCEAVTMDLSKTELEDLEQFTQETMQQFQAAMERFTKILPGSNLKVT